MPASYTYLKLRSKLFSTTPVGSRDELLMRNLMTPVNGCFALPGWSLTSTAVIVQVALTPSDGGIFSPSRFKAAASFCREVVAASRSDLDGAPPEQAQKAIAARATRFRFTAPPAESDGRDVHGP